jgi:3-oxoacyl-[acyl-carrier protein] reductase
MDLGLAGRRAIVTGGSKGLGKAIAGELLDEGAAVFICSRNARELDETVAQLKERADDPAAPVRAMTCDVTDPEQVSAFVAAAAQAMGGVDILVNNAGGARPGRFGTPTGRPTSRSSCSRRSAVSEPRCRNCVAAPRPG